MIPFAGQPVSQTQRILLPTSCASRYKNASSCADACPCPEMDPGLPTRLQGKFGPHLRALLDVHPEAPYGNLGVYRWGEPREE